MTTKYIILLVLSICSFKLFGIGFDISPYLKHDSVYAKKRVKKVIFKNESGYQYTIDYDTLGRQIKFREGDDPKFGKSYMYETNKNVVVCKVYDEYNKVNPNLDLTYSIKYDHEGRVIEFYKFERNLKIEVDSNSFIQESTEYDSTEALFININYSNDTQLVIYSFAKSNFSPEKLVTLKEAIPFIVSDTEQIVINSNFKSLFTTSFRNGKVSHSDSSLFEEGKLIKQTQYCDKLYKGVEPINNYIVIRDYHYSGKQCTIKQREGFTKNDKIIITKKSNYYQRLNGQDLEIESYEIDSKGQHKNKEFTSYEYY